MDIDQLRETNLFRNTRRCFPDVEEYYSVVEPMLVENYNNLGLHVNVNAELSHAFLWDNTPQGSKFWNRIYAQLRD